MPVASLMLLNNKRDGWWKKRQSVKRHKLWLTNCGWNIYLWPWGLLSRTLGEDRTNKGPWSYWLHGRVASGTLKKGVRWIGRKTRRALDRGDEEVVGIGVWKGVWERGYRELYDDSWLLNQRKRKGQRRLRSDFKILSRILGVNCSRA